MRDPKKSITKEELDSCLRMTSSSWRFQNAGIDSLKDLIMRSPDSLLRLSGITRKGLGRELQAIARTYPTILEDVPEMNKEIAEMISQLIPDEYKNPDPSANTNEEKQEDPGTKFGTDEEKMGDVIEKIAGSTEEATEKIDDSNDAEKVNKESDNRDTQEPQLVYPLKQILNMDLFEIGHIYQIRSLKDHSCSFGILQTANPAQVSFMMIQKDSLYVDGHITRSFTAKDITDGDVAIDQCNLNPYIALHHTVLTGYGDAKINFTFRFNKDKMIFNNIFNSEDKKNYYRTSSIIQIIGTKVADTSRCREKEIEAMEKVLNKKMLLIGWEPNKIVLGRLGNAVNDMTEITPEMLYNYTQFSNIQIERTRFDKDVSDYKVALINIDTCDEIEIVTGIPVSVSEHGKTYNGLISEIWENNAGFDIISEEGKKAPIHCIMLPDIDSINMASKINVNAVVYKNDKTYSVCKFVSKKKD